MNEEATDAIERLTRELAECKAALAEARGALERVAFLNDPEGLNSWKITEVIRAALARMGKEPSR